MTSRQQRDRERYLAHREERLAHQHEYYVAHREEILWKKRMGLKM